MEQVETRPGRPTVLAGLPLRGEAGSGGFAVTWIADHPALGPVAVKALSSHVLRDADVVTRFELECEKLAATASIGDPDRCLAVPYHVDHGRDGDVPYLVQELCTGGSLQHRLTGSWTGDLDRRIGHSAWVLVAAARQLAVVHRRLQVIHRDLTPGNLLFRRLADGTEDLVIADFGLMKQAELQSNFSRIVGTAAYVAPEVRRHGVCDHRSDVYSLGILAWELLTGRRADPAAAPPPIDTVEPGVPGELVAMVTAMTAPARVDRPQLEEVSAAFVAAATTAPPDPEGPADAGRRAGAGPRKRGRRSRPALLGGVTLVLVGGLAVSAADAETTVHSPPGGGFEIELSMAWELEPAAGDVPPADPAVLLAASRPSGAGLELEVRTSSARTPEDWVRNQVSGAGGSTEVVARDVGEESATIRYRRDGDEVVSRVLARGCGVIALSVLSEVPIPAESLDEIDEILSGFHLTDQISLPVPVDSPQGFVRFERNGVSLAVPDGYQLINEPESCLTAFDDGHMIEVLVDPDPDLEAAVAAYRDLWRENDLDSGAAVQLPSGATRLQVSDDRFEQLFYLFEGPDVVHTVYVRDDAPLTDAERSRFDRIASTLSVP